MDLRAWRERMAQGEQFCLPSGLVVRLRRVSLMDLMEQGSIPAPLAATVEQILDRKEVKLSVSEFPRFAGVINEVVKASIVDPPMSDEPGEDVLWIRELPMGDRLAVFNWSAEAGDKLRPFRAEAGEPVDGVVSGDSVLVPGVGDPWRC